MATIKNFRAEDQVNLLGQIVGVFASETPFEFADKTTALLASGWETRMLNPKGARMYILRASDNVTAPVNEDIFVMGNTNLFEYKVRNGDKTIQLDYYFQSREQIEALKSFEGKKMYIAIITRNGWILTDTTDGTKINGIPVNTYFISEKSPESSDGMWNAGIKFKISEFSNGYAKAIKPVDEAVASWRPQDYDGIIDATLTVGTIADTSLEVTVTGTADGVAIEGLDNTAYWTMTNLGSAHVVTSVTAVGNVYTLGFAATGAGAATIDLKAPSITTKFVETAAATSFTAV